MGARWLRILFGALLFLEVLLIPSPWNVFRPTRRQAVKALFEWQRNPTPQTESAWLAEKRKLDRDDLFLRMISLVLLAGNTIALILVWRLLRAQRAAGSQAHIRA